MDLKAFDKISYGLYLVCSKNGEKAAGCVVNTLGQVTVEPVRVTVTINKENCTAKMIQETGLFTAVTLAETASMELIGTFGFHSSDEVDKFENCQTKMDANGLPYVSEQAVAWYSCKVVDTMDAGTHFVFLADVLEAEVLEDNSPMTYAYYHTVKKGLTPPRASSYRLDPVKGYRCQICGYVWESDTLPDDFICPICGRGREVMEKVTG